MAAAIARIPRPWLVRLLRSRGARENERERERASCGLEEIASSRRRKIIDQTRVGGAESERGVVWEAHIIHSPREEIRLDASGRASLKGRYVRVINVRIMRTSIVKLQSARLRAGGYRFALRRDGVICWCESGFFTFGVDEMMRIIGNQVYTPIRWIRK